MEYLVYERCSRMDKNCLDVGPVAIPIGTNASSPSEACNKAKEIIKRSIFTPQGFSDYSFRVLSVHNKETLLKKFKVDFFVKRCDENKENERVVSSSFSLTASDIAEARIIAENDVSCHGMQNDYGARVTFIEELQASNPTETEEIDKEQIDFRFTELSPPITYSDGCFRVMRMVDTGTDEDDGNSIFRVCVSKADVVTGFELLKSNKPSIVGGENGLIEFVRFTLDKKFVLLRVYGIEHPRKTRKSYDIKRSTDSLERDCQ